MVAETERKKFEDYKDSTWVIISTIKGILPEHLNHGKVDFGAVYEYGRSKFGCNITFKRTDTLGKIRYAMPDFLYDAVNKVKPVEEILLMNGPYYQESYALFFSNDKTEKRFGPQIEKTFTELGFTVDKSPGADRYKRIQYLLKKDTKL